MSEPRWLTQRHRLVEEWANEYGPLFRMRLAWIDVRPLPQVGAFVPSFAGRLSRCSGTLVRPSFALGGGAGHSGCQSTLGNRATWGKRPHSSVAINISRGLLPYPN